MFLTDDYLKNRLKALNELVQRETDEQAFLEEYIALPAFGGQIMARFQLVGEQTLSLDEVERLESLLRKAAGEAFMVDFMGDVYRRLGVDYTRLEEIISALGRRFAHEPIVNGPYREQVLADARTLLSACDLPQTMPVWEIQIEGNELALLLLGQSNRALFSVDGQMSIRIYEASSALCQGIMRAAFAARRMKVSLGKLLLEEMALLDV